MLDVLNLDNNTNIIKAEFVIDLANNIDIDTCLNTFINKLKNKTITDEEIVDDCFIIIYSLGKYPEIFSKLMLLYPKCQQTILVYQIMYYKRYNTNTQLIYPLIKSYYEIYGEQKNILLIELDCLIMDGYKDVDRINYIVKKVKTM